MKQFIIVALLSTCLGRARADSIDYIITLNSPGASGSFTYDHDIAAFSSFAVTWRGFFFDLTSPANNPSLAFKQLAPLCLADGLTGGAASFALLSGDCAIPFGAGNYATQWGGNQGTFNIHSIPGFAFFSTCAADDTCMTEPKCIFFGVGNATSCSTQIPFFNEKGQWSITEKPVVHTPEPASVLLLLTLLCTGVYKIAKPGRS